MRLRQDPRVEAPFDSKALVAAAAAMAVTIDEARAERLLAYLDAMLALNEQINLTAVRERGPAVVLHVLDGLAFARTELHPRHVLDLGSGNGFPGICIAALHPAASVVLMDRTGKKVRAIGSCLLTARWDQVETVQLDAAQAPALRADLRHAFDCVTARAVGTPALCAELARPLLRPGGSLALWLDVDAELPAKLDGYRRERMVTYDLPEPAPRRRQIGRWTRI
jgi:16S rRNA (guanine527-N7)-methyltransferase